MTARRGIGGLALFSVLFVAKCLAVASVGMPQAGDAFRLFGGDALVALGFGLGVQVLPRLVVLPAYALLSLHAALALAVVQAIGTPPGAAMMHGVDAAMTDSIRLYVTWRGLGGAAAVLAVAWLAPWLSRRVSARMRGVGVLGGGGLVVALLATGPSMLPAHRNALVFLLQSARAPRATTVAAVPRPIGHGVSDPALLALRGRARDCNVVVVVLESAGARFLRPFGGELDPMPFLTGLAARSLICTRAYAVHPESIKAQIAMFHAVHPAPRVDAERYARIPVPGLAARLDAAGYATGIFHAGRFRFLHMRDVLARSGYRQLADAGDIGGERESSFGVDEESTVDALLAWIDARERRPFMAAYLPVAGHHPYDSPRGGPFPTDTPIDCYRNALHYADTALERLWNGLVQRGLAASTLLVVVGDHGEAFGEHDGNFGHTFAIYDENLRVPLLFRPPGGVAHPLHIDAVVSQVDIAPTILDLCGFDVDPAAEGSSLLRVTGRPALFFADWGSVLIGVRDGRFKLICDLDTGRDLLFDLDVDPDESRDIARQEPLRVESMRKLARGFFLGRVAIARAW